MIKVWIDFANPDGVSAPRTSVRLEDPVQVWQAHYLHEVQPVLDAVEAAALDGKWCAGYVRYEAAPAFDTALRTHAAQGPLAWFAAFDKARTWDDEVAALPHETDFALQWNTFIQREEFACMVSDIRESIASGEIYQANFTSVLQGQFEGNPQHLFLALRQVQPQGYCAWIDTGETGEQVLSVSPELFFDRQGTRLLTRPMKGTAPRGMTPEEDASNAEALRLSPKERAENVMIVDLLRNDLSRVAKPHSVQVPRLFHTEAYSTVWQMTSDVVAETIEGTRLSDIFKAIFPCGSVTGAPKVKAMELLMEWESHPRGVYCGAVGVVRPGGHATFNVPIRTVELQNTGLARCGLGSAIVADAQVESEWREWQHKRAFVERAGHAFALLETLALEEGALRHGAEHCARMQKASRHFGYPWDPSLVSRTLSMLAQQHPEGLWRIRCTLDRTGHFEATAVPQLPMRPADFPVHLRLAPAPLLHAHSEFVRYKTTNRAHYDTLAPQDEKVFDHVLWNDAGEITECTRGNVAWLQDGQWWTPALHCGLLGGIERGQWLAQGRLRESVLHCDALEQVDGWAFLNSLRGWLPAVMDV